MATLKSVQKKINELERQGKARIAKQSVSVIKTIRDLMAKHGLTTADIDAHAGGKQRVKNVAAKTAATRTATPSKYRDPKTGATWTGHGRAPGWIASAKNRDRFLIDSNAATAETRTAVSKSAPADNHKRGPQPAKYRDPKSGATWSGRGRAPAWFKNAKRIADLFVFDTSSPAANKKSFSKSVPKSGPTKTTVRKALPKAAPAKKVAAKRYRISADAGMAGDARQKPKTKPTVPDVKSD
jgi:DNA-binding protein H-NS